MATSSKEAKRKPSENQRRTLVTLGKLGQTIVAEVPDKKGTGGAIEPDPDMIATMNQLKEGDSVWVEMNGKMLALIEAYVEPITGKFTKYTESEVEGHKLRGLEIDQDGKTLTLLVPGRANGKAWITDSSVTRQLLRVPARNDGAISGKRGWRKELAAVDRTCAKDPS